LINRITIIPLSDKDHNLFKVISEIRTRTHLKLPDAIIAGTAIYNNAVLITNDNGFSKVFSLKPKLFK
jgi:predicted nucleic acid-binding protein